MHTSHQPFIVGLGGTLRPGSSCEKAITLALGHARELGADTEFFSGDDLNLPLFCADERELSGKAQRLVSSLRRSDGIVIASPGYHGSISGLVKNALDYTEYMRTDRNMYFDGRAVGSIVCAAGWQTVGTTLTTMRSIVHALRGWPTPIGVGINTSGRVFSANGACEDEKVSQQIRQMVDQVYAFAEMKLASCIRDEPVAM